MIVDKDRVRISHLHSLICMRLCSLFPTKWIVCLNSWLLTQLLCNLLEVDLLTGCKTYLDLENWLGVDKITATKAIYH